MTKRESQGSMTTGTKSQSSQARRPAKGSRGQVLLGILRSTREAATRPPGYTPWSPHHFYWGIIIAFGGFAALFYLPESAAPFYWGTVVIGFGISIEDVWQHHHQKQEPTYTSPLHRWYWSALNHAIRFCEVRPNWHFALPALRWFHRI